jgi:HEAT repeat protein/beta-lactamase regulating signal transducer with metallopeptidase domain
MTEIGFPLLVDAAVKGTLVLLAATGLALLLRRGSAASRHLIWQMAVLAVLMLPLIKAVSPFTIPVLPELRSPIAAAPAAVEPNTSLNSVSAPSAPASNSNSNVVQPNVEARFGVEQNAGAQPSVAPFALRALTWIAFAWIVVAAALLMRLALGFVLVRWFALRAYPLYEEGWAELNTELSALIGLKGDVQLYASPHIATPMTWGITRPVIMLPSSAEDWSLERKRVVMLHELAHIRRRDSLTHMIAQIACAVYWFHPLVWKANARMRAEAERASDDLVLAAGTKPSVYADHLLELIRTIGGMRTPALALPMAQRSTFEGRLLAILEPHLDRTTPRPLSVAGMVAVVGLIVFPLAGLTTATAISTEGDRLAQDDTKTESMTELKTTDDVAQRMASSVSEKIAISPPATDLVGSVAMDHLKSAKQPSGQQHAIAPLVRALSDSDVSVRLVAAQSLGQLEDTAGVAALSRALRSDSDAGVRKMAAWALGNIEDEEGVPALVHALQNDRDIDVRRTSVWALGQIEEAVAVPALTDALRDSDERVRKLAVWALGQIEDASAVPALLNVLKTGDVEMRRQAAWALGQIEDASAVAGLAAALRDSDPDVREQAVWALGQIESPAAVGPLSAFIDDPNLETRKMVAWALGQIEDAGAVPALSTMLREDKSVAARETAAWALGQIESSAAVPALSAALKDAAPSVRAQAAWALGQIEARPAPQALLDALKDSDKNVRATAAWALASIEDPASAGALRAALNDSDAYVRQSVLQALVSLGDQIGYEALAEMMKDANPEVRRAAAAAMGGKRGNWVDPKPMPMPQPRPRPMPDPIR